MRKKYLLLLGFALHSVIGHTQQIYSGASANRMIRGAELIRYKEHNTAPNYVQFLPGNRPDADQLMPWLRKVLGMKPEDQLLHPKVTADGTGTMHTLFAQYYNGVPVEAGQYAVHEKNGMVMSVSGAFYPGITLSVAPSISQAQAIASAMQHTGAATYKWQLAEEEAHLKYETGSIGATYYPQPKLVIIPVNGDYKKAEFRLAYKMDIYAQQPFSRNFVYVDAATGKVILKRNRIHTVDVPGTAITGYSGSRGIVADLNASVYRLLEAGRGNGIETRDMNQGTSYGASVHFTDTDNNWNNVNAQFDQYATDAHWGAEMTYDYFDVVHNRNSIDGNGFKLFSYVHYDAAYDNAFWDGQRMTYGDGGGFFDSPLTTIDIAGHEITHGLVTNTADLVYQDESGALNESFADIFGVSIDNWARGTTGALLWRMGEECTGGNGIRDMSNPNLFGDPDTYNGTNWYTGTGDNGGVHTNSGVQNHWFYRLVQGGNGTNDLGNAYTVTGQGMTKAAAIAFRNLTTPGYLDQNSDYADARFYAILSAIDLFGACTPEVIATTNAWYAVGVGGPFVATVDAAFIAPTTSFCQAPAVVTFNSTSTNAGSHFWTFGDGGTSTAVNPTHTYANYGTYTVKLVVNGGSCGNDSVIMTNLIVVDNNIPCAVTMNPNGSNQTQTSCSGTLYDTGGPSNDYNDNSNSIITIAPFGGTAVTLNFTSFNFESGYDYLYIYDGPSITSPLIGQYDGTALPNGGTITSTGGSITLRQYTDQAVVESGFVVNWSCQLPTTPPVPDFIATSLTSCDGEINFIDQTTNGANAWLWNFGDGNTSTLQSPTHVYQNDGIYTVTLTATNNIGSDAEVKTNYITIDRPDAPVANDMAICVPGSVTINASATGGLINWYNTQAATSPFFTGTSYLTPVLGSTVTYYLQNAIASALLNLGPLNNTIGTGGFHNNTSIQYLTFDVFQPVNINSVWVNANGAGFRTISLWDNSGNLIDSRYVNIPAGQSRVTVNFSVAPGTGYRLGGTEMNLYRNQTGAAYPYTLSGLVSITGSSAGAPFYYYYYDWEVQGATCVSPLTPVTVSVGGVGGSFTALSSGLTANFTGTATGATSWNWNFGDGNTSTQQNPSHTYASFGTYTVTLIVGNGSCADTIVQQVVLAETGLENTAPGAVIKVMPNPFTDQLFVGIELPSATMLHIEALNMLGEKLAVLYSGSAPAGNHTYNWSPGYIAPGMYLVNIYIDNQRMQQKVVHVR